VTVQTSEFAAQSSAGDPWLHRLASLRLTLAIIALLLAGSVVALHNSEHMTWSLAVPMALFALNLASAVIVNPAFRRQSALLLFHLALIAIVLLVAAGRLTYLRGDLELTEGAVFDGQLTDVEAGPWHGSRFHNVSFENLGFTIEYAPGIRRGKTRNRVRWIDEAGRPQSAIIGDMDALTLRGYSFYTTHHKGFAPVFTWWRNDGEALFGSVHLPPYPAFEKSQAREWTPPGTTRSIGIMLQFDEVILDPARPSEFRVPRQHALVVRVGDELRELRPGGRLELAEGTLVYEGLRAWMGYTVSYDWTMPWLLAACIAATLSLAWHFWRKFVAQPWLAPQ